MSNIMIASRIVVLLLFPKGLSAGSCNFVVIWCNPIFNSAEGNGLKNLYKYNRYNFANGRKVGGTYNTKRIYSYIGYDISYN